MKPAEERVCDESSPWPGPRHPTDYGQPHAISGPSTSAPWPRCDCGTATSIARWTHRS